MYLYRAVFNNTFKNLKFFSRTIISSTYPDINVKKETFAETIFTYCQKYSNRIACIDDVKNVTYTFSDFRNCIINIASSLTKQGVKQGTMAGIVASNSPEYIMLIYALSGIGCTVTLCNQNFTQNEMMYQLMDSKPSLLFTDSESLEKVSHVASQCSFVKDVYLIGSRKPNYKSVEDLLNDSGDMNPIGSLKLNYNDDIALLPYSSGTTGLPKGVMLTNFNLVTNFHQINLSHIISEKKVMLVALPLYHIYAAIVMSSMFLYSGSTLVIQPKFNLSNFLRAIEKYKVSILHLVPPQILIFLNHPAVSNYNLTSVEKCFSAAAPLDATFESRFVEKFKVHQPDFDIYQGYGMSEASPITNVMPNIKRLPGKQGSVGLMVPNMSCKVVDIFTREEVPANTSGELLYRGPNIMKGYYGKPKETKESFEGDWYKTGDIGSYDEDHYFYISDRLKDVIKVKGCQVAPAELEATLLSMPGVADCAVIGVPDERCGEVPKAFVVRNKDITETEINDYMANLLSSHKQLNGGITFVDEIPKSPSGKILRRLLKP